MLCFLKGLFMDICPNEVSVLLCEVEERFDDIRQVWAEVVEVVDHATEPHHSLFVIGDGHF